MILLLAIVLNFSLLPQFGPLTSQLIRGYSFPRHVSLVWCNMQNIAKHCCHSCFSRNKQHRYASLCIPPKPHVFNPSFTHGLPAGSQQSQQSHCLKLILASLDTHTACKTSLRWSAPKCQLPRVNRAETEIARQQGPKMYRTLLNDPNEICSDTTIMYLTDAMWYPVYSNYRIISITEMIWPWDFEGPVE